jgi:hypothetical protein
VEGANMLNLIRKLFSVENDPQALKVKEAIELVVAESVPKIRYISGYQKKLRQPVEAALKFCGEMAGQIPGTVDLSDKDKTNLALMGGFFKNYEHAREIVASSKEVKEFLDKHKANEIYVLLVMHRQEKRQYGSRLQGEILVKDIPQKAVLFDRHELIFPSATVEDAYKAVQLGLLKVLAHHSLELIMAEQGREIELGKLRDELDVKLKIMRKERQQMVLEWKDSESQQTYTDSQRLLDEIEDELKRVRSQTDQRDYYLDQVIDVVGHPEQYLSVNLTPMKLDRLGIFVKSKSCTLDDELCVAEFSLVTDEKRSVVLIKCHRDQLKTER